MVSQTYSSIDQASGARSDSPMRTFISQVTDTTRSVAARQRPWTQLMDRAAFDKPESVADAFSRMKKNLSYFRMNYAIFMLVVVALSLLWHPISLLVLAILVAAWIYLYFSRSEPLVIFNRPIGDNQVLIVLGIVTIVALFLTSAGAALITSLVLGVVIICVHAAFRRPDDLFLDEQENAALARSKFPTSTGVSQSSRV